MIDKEVKARIGKIDKKAAKARELADELLEEVQELEDFLVLLREDKRNKVAEWCESSGIGFERFRSLRRLSRACRKHQTPDKRLLTELGILPKVERAKPKRRNAPNTLMKKAMDLTEEIAKRKEGSGLTEVEEDILRQCLKSI